MAPATWPRSAGRHLGGWASGGVRVRRTQRPERSAVTVHIEVNSCSRERPDSAMLRPRNNRRSAALVVSMTAPRATRGQAHRTPAPNAAGSAAEARKERHVVWGCNDPSKEVHDRQRPPSCSPSRLNAYPADAVEVSSPHAYRRSMPDQTTPIAGRRASFVDHGALRAPSDGHGGPARRRATIASPCRRPFGNSSWVSQRQAATIASTSRRHSIRSTRSRSG